MLKSAIQTLRQVLENIVSDPLIQLLLDDNDIKQLKETITLVMTGENNLFKKFPEEAKKCESEIFLIAGYIDHLSSTLGHLLSPCGILHLDAKSLFKAWIGSSKRVQEISSTSINANTLKEFLKSTLQGELSLSGKIGRYGTENSETINLDLIQGDAAVLYTMLSKPELKKEEALKALDGIWEDFARTSPSELITIVCTHPKTRDILSQQEALQWLGNTLRPNIIAILVRRMHPPQDMTQFWESTLSSSRAVSAIATILTHRYFELSRGQKELSLAIEILDSIIRKELYPPYQIVLLDHEPADITQIKLHTVYLFATKEGDICYTAKEYDDSVTSGILWQVSAPKPKIKQLIDDLKSGTCYGRSVTPQENKTIRSLLPRYRDINTSEMEWCYKKFKQVSPPCKDAAQRDSETTIL